MTSILLLNGPNLNLLGRRETPVYGHKTLAEIVGDCKEFAASCGFSVSHLQSNGEQELIEAIHHSAETGIDGIVFNPAALTHTSIALRDALLAVAVPFVEVHLSQPPAREAFRNVSYFSDIALGTIAGFGADSYLLALQALINHLDAARDNAAGA